MAEIILFHHALGLTAGMRGIAQQLTDAGHHVRLPDLFEGQTFTSFDAAMAHLHSLGSGVVLERGVQAAEDAPEGAVFAGFSLGVMPAQKLAQTRPDAAGALFFEACMPQAHFGGWPTGLPVQIHGSPDDEWFDEDLEAARALAEDHAEAELFLYPGVSHLFADSSLDSYDPDAAALLIRRTLDFLQGLGSRAEP